MCHTLVPSAESQACYLFFLFYFPTLEHAKQMTLQRRRTQQDIDKLAQEHNNVNGSDRPITRVTTQSEKHRGPLKYTNRLIGSPQLKNTRLYFGMDVKMGYDLLLIKHKRLLRALL
jgi:hypothetical protein